MSCLKILYTPNCIDSNGKQYDVDNTANTIELCNCFLNYALSIIKSYLKLEDTEKYTDPRIHKVVKNITDKPLYWDITSTSYYPNGVPDSMQDFPAWVSNIYANLLSSVCNTMYIHSWITWIYHDFEIVILLGQKYDYLSPSYPTSFSTASVLVLVRSIQNKAVLSGTYYKFGEFSQVAFYDPRYNQTPLEIFLTNEKRLVNNVVVDDYFACVFNYPDYMTKRTGNNINVPYLNTIAQNRLILSKLMPPVGWNVDKAITDEVYACISDKNWNNSYCTYSPKIGNEPLDFARPLVRWHFAEEALSSYTVDSFNDDEIGLQQLMIYNTSNYEVLGGLKGLYICPPFSALLFEIGKVYELVFNGVKRKFLTTFIEPNFGVIPSFKRTGAYYFPVFILL